MERDLQINGMHSKVKEAEETMQRERKKNQDRIEQVQIEYSDKEKRLLEKLKADMSKLIQEQLKEL